MNAKQKRRLAFAAALVAVGGLVAAAIVYSLGQNTMYFQAPSDLAANAVRPGMAFHLGGLVANGSVQRGPDADVRFTVTDGKNSVPVIFHGVLPALFREGQGVITAGALNETGTFQATEVLAKHDEKYMPPEVVQALKKSGRWQEGQGK